MFSRCRIYLIAVSSAPLMRIDVSQAIVFFPLQRNFNTVARPDSLLLFCFYLVFAPTACFVFSIVSPALTFYDDPFIFAFYDGGFFSSLRWVPSFSFSLTKGEGLSAYLGKTPLILTTALKISSRLGKEKPGINQVPWMLVEVSEPSIPFALKNGWSQGIFHWWLNLNDEADDSAADPIKDVVGKIRLNGNFPK